MDKIENLEIKEYLINFVIEKTQQCQIFAKVFGKDFARDRLKTNLKTVYTNEYSRKKAGYHSTNEHTISICTSDKQEPQLTVKLLEKNKQKVTTMLHEAIHAILTKSEEECKKIGVKHATGILEYYEKKEDDEQIPELGRGANEGLTNWICELLGYKTSSYQYETTFIKQLELVMGQTRILKMGKGNICKNVSKQLHMSQKQTKKFLSKIDDVYNENDKITQFDEYIYYLKKYVDIEKLTEGEREEVLKELYILTNHPAISSITQSIEYREGLIETDQQIEYEIKYFEELTKQSQLRLGKLVANVESIIFDKYFKKKFEKIKNSNKMSTKDFEMFNKLSELMSTDCNDERLKRYSSFDFLKDFKKIYNKRSEEIKKSAKNCYEHGELTFENFIKLFKEAQLMSEKEAQTFINDVAKMLYPNNYMDFSMLFSYLIDNNQLSEAKHYSILNVSRNGYTMPIVMKDGRPECSWRFYKSKQLQPGEATEDFIDCTLEMDEEYTNVIKEFDKLKRRALAIDPEATINLVDTAIFVQYANDKQNIFLINNGRILPANNTTQIPVQFQEDIAMMPTKSKATAFRAKQRLTTILENTKSNVCVGKQRTDKSEINR